MKRANIFHSSLSALTFCSLVIAHPPQHHQRGHHHPQHRDICTYTLTHNVVGADFYDFFDFENIDDPTRGRTKYVDYETALCDNLTYTTPDTFILRADHTMVLDPEGKEGRKTVRIMSKETFTTHVTVFDVRHMPEGCGTWPAIWELHTHDWPSGGEIDILEGVNSGPINGAAIHTNAGCEMPPSSDPASERVQRGLDKENNCDWKAHWNAGCGVAFEESVPSFGPRFNEAGGGWFVLERTRTDMSIWFWSRDDLNVPEEIRCPESQVVDPSQYGAPQAYFPDTLCDFDKMFKEFNIVINLALCGDWAGSESVWKESKCPAPTCQEFVDANPEAFVDAYFDIGSVRIYEEAPAQPWPEEWHHGKHHPGHGPEHGRGGRHGGRHHGE